MLTFTFFYISHYLPHDGASYTYLTQFYYSCRVNKFHLNPKPNHFNAILVFLSRHNKQFMKKSTVFSRKNRNYFKRKLLANTYSLVLVYTVITTECQSVIYCRLLHLFKSFHFIVGRFWLEICSSIKSLI